MCVETLKLLVSKYSEPLKQMLNFIASKLNWFTVSDAIAYSQSKPFLVIC